LHSNKETQPSLFLSSRAAYLRLSRTSINGTLPTQVGRLTALQEFWVHGTDISGMIPSEFGMLSEVKDLRFQETRITGQIPDEIFDLKKLQRLDLWQDGNGLTGTLSPKIGQLTHSVVTLRLHNNSFTGAIPSEIGLLTNLDTLSLQHNELQGRVPQATCDTGGPYISADCTPSNKTDSPFVECELGCCAMCCEGSTQSCTEMSV
jgi:Leucine-rich repeat (LRR) protein